jgi:hypothetical protein
MESSIPTPPGRSAANELRAMAVTWALAATLPLPVLVMTDPAGSGDISCLYLGAAGGWLAAEFHRSGGLPESAGRWRARMLALATAVAVNAAVFIAFGIAAGVQTHFPFPLMAVLSAIPAVGVLPWLSRRVRRQPYVAIVFGAMLVFAAKLAACVVARIVYGPDYIEQGYVAADWRSAKLMISLFWSFSTLLSAGLLLADYSSCKRTALIAAVTKEVPIRSSTAAAGTA